jgi:hypothetical protein
MSSLTCAQMEMHNTDPFSTCFDYASGKTGDRFQNPLWQITEIFNGRRFRKSVGTLHEFGSVIVKKAVESRECRDQLSSSVGVSVKGSEETSGTLIHSLLDSVNDHHVVADAALNYLSAGQSYPRSCSSLHRLTSRRQRYDSTGFNMGILPPYSSSKYDSKNTAGDCPRRCRRYSR